MLLFSGASERGWFRRVQMLLFSGASERGWFLGESLQLKVTQ